MTTTDERQGRTTVDLLRYLPLALIITMFGAAVLIAQVVRVHQVIDGQASVSVWISERDVEPWWRTGSEPPIADIALLCALAGAAAGVTTYLLNKRTRPQADTWRSPVALGTGVLGLALLLASIPVIEPSRSTNIFVVLAFTPAATASAAMGAWQYQLGGAGGHGRARCWVYAIGAAIVTALYTATFVFSGFSDHD